MRRGEALSVRALGGLALGRRSRLGAVGSGAALLAMSALTRIFEAGNRSARGPRYVMVHTHSTDTGSTWSNPATRRSLQELGARHWRGGPHLWRPNRHALSRVAPGNSLESDPLILDDQALVVHVRGLGRVVLTGCGHAGIVDIVRHAQRLTGIDQVHAVVGGFHLNGPVFASVILPTVETLSALPLK